MITEVVFIGRNNTNTLLLFEGVNKTPHSLAAVTRVVLKLGTLTIDSDVLSTVFDWTNSPTHVLTMKLGTVVGLAAGLYALEDPVNCLSLRIYEPTTTAGVEWGGGIRIEVKPEC